MLLEPPRQDVPPRHGVSEARQVRREADSGTGVGRLASRLASAQRPFPCLRDVPPRGPRPPPLAPRLRLASAPPRRCLARSAPVRVTIAASSGAGGAACSWSGSCSWRPPAASRRWCSTSSCPQRSRCCRPRSSVPPTSPRPVGRTTRSPRSARRRIAPTCSSMRCPPCSSRRCSPRRTRTSTSTGASTPWASVGPSTTTSGGPAPPRVDPPSPSSTSRTSTSPLSAASSAR